MSRDGMDTLSHGGLFVYLGAEGVDEADWSKVATQFGLGEGVVTYRDGPSTMVEVAPFEISEWYTFEASIHFDDTDPDGGFYDLTITSTDQNWTEFTATGIQFRGGADAVSAEDVLINRFNCGEATAWVDDLVIARRESIPGDLNDDGFVGGDDLDIIRNHWGQTVTMGKLEVGDPSGDGVVGGDDLDIIRANWGQGSPPMISTIPEPASWILLIGAAFTLAAGTRLHTLLKYPRCQNRVNY